MLGGHTLVIVIVHQLVWRHHVQQLQHPADARVGGCCAGKHGHGVDAHLARNLGDADAGFLDLERALAEHHVVQPLDGNTGDAWVGVFEEGNALAATVSHT